MNHFAIFNRIDAPEGLTQTRRPFFNRAAGRDFAVNASGDRTEITLYDEIGMWGVSASDLRAQLAGIRGGTIHLKINSPGGDVFDGIAMHNDLKAHPARVEVEVVGLAASAASLIAMAGDHITVPSNAFLMIHNAWTVVAGDRRAMTEASGVLEQIDTALAKTYAERTGQDAAAVRAMMDAETWMSGDQAVELGFAQAKGGETPAQAAFDLTVFANVPAALRALQVGPANTKRDFERVLTRDAGLSRSQARALLRSGLSAVEAMQDAGEDDAELTAALARLHATIKR
ncbi:head maturation protease, ClpP-related [Azospirillum sp.]|uniref:head maturation protease, ClpP-related n=1 Tax=Azospirillum sp. TaxID=34012 RepID=UPI002D2FE941|nr:head maturation protease, ClpP-related [Azospirillum sp.]HYF87419.1 head maturation protease, ClpP-related [Azospirillum sp.]